jgi:hypothetical protein
LHRLQVRMIMEESPLVMIHGSGILSMFRFVNGIPAMAGNRSLIYHP